MQKRIRVLFVCTGNSCRSQIAEGLLKHHGNDKYEVYSAGLKPSHVHPLAIKVMDESGIDITSQYSKTVNVFLDQEFSYVVTVCGGAKEHCPSFQGKHVTLHWNIDDPATAKGTEEEMLKVFRNVREKILEEVNRFISGRSFA